MNKSVLFSGESPNLQDYYTAQFRNNAENNITTIILDYKNNVRYPAAIDLGLAEFLPYLTNEEIAELFSQIALKTSPESAHLIHRFISLFNDLSRKAGLSLFSDWSMLSLLELSERYNCERLHWFLEDNYNSLNTLDNQVKYIVNSIGNPRFDLKNSLNTGKVFAIRNNRLGRNIYRIELFEIVLSCITEFVNFERTDFYINGVGEDWSDSIVSFLSNNHAHRTVVTDDVFTYSNSVISNLLYNVEKVVFFKHHSGESCQRIADYIGKEERYQIGINRYPDTAFSLFHRLFRNGISLTQSLSIVGGDRTNVGYSANLTDKYRLRPDEIMSLDENQCIIVNTSDHSFTIEHI